MSESKNSTAALGWSNRLQPLVTRSLRGFLEDRWTYQNSAKLHPGLSLEHWSAVCDGLHNLTTDLTEFQGYFYLTFSSSPWHIGSHKSRIRLLRSKDAREWESVCDWQVQKGDIRDPKLSVINGKLVLYVLKNSGWLAEPGSTAAAISSDGVNWSRLEDCEPKGWLFLEAQNL